MAAAGGFLLLGEMSRAHHIAIADVSASKTVAKQWMGQCLIELEAGIEHRFSASFPSDVHAFATVFWFRFEELTGPCGDDVESLRQAGEELVHDLEDVKMHTAPCFPPDYHIFDFYIQVTLVFFLKNCRIIVNTATGMQCYHRRFQRLVEHLKSANLEPGEIIILVCWLRDYHESLEKIVSFFVFCFCWGKTDRVILQK